MPAPITADTDNEVGNEPDNDTRSRILRAAVRLFRKHGYHGVGINDILAQAQAPKGSMYHHFPGGKEEIGVEVVRFIATGVIGLMTSGPADASALRMITQAGSRMAQAIVQTNHELCALYAGFIAERSAAPRLAEAVALAYEEMSGLLAGRLMRDGFTRAQAVRRAGLIVMLLEGGSLVSAAQKSDAAFKAAVKHAAALCRLDDEVGA
jgi:TetR/AcrR family transcriptional regulator, lmrAB and yxaGH operons repressor